MHNPSAIKVQIVDFTLSIDLYKRIICLSSIKAAGINLGSDSSRLNIEPLQVINVHRTVANCESTSGFILETVISLVKRYHF